MLIHLLGERKAFQPLDLSVRQSGQMGATMILENTPALVTERLILRKFAENDLAALFSLYADQEVNTFLPWFPIETPEETKAVLEESYVKNYVKPQGYHYAVCLKEDNVPIGYVNVSMEESHDFGYGLRREFWGQGIVTEAGRAVTVAAEGFFGYIPAIPVKS